MSSPRQSRPRGFTIKLIMLIFTAFAAVFVLSRYFNLQNAHHKLQDDGSLHLIRDSDVQLKVDVYYEVLCPDSRYFIIKQLLPAWRDLNSIMLVTLKPYGKASHKRGAKGEWEFQCQHGATECEGNIVHACAAKHISDPNTLMEYVSCMIDNNYRPIEVGERCAEKHAIDSWPAILKCSTSSEGQDILATIGDETHALRPRITFIPTIAIDGSQEGQKKILKDFSKELCERYRGSETPKKCKTISP